MVFTTNRRPTFLTRNYAISSGISFDNEEQCSVATCKLHLLPVCGWYPPRWKFKLRKTPSCFPLYISCTIAHQASTENRSYVFQHLCRSSPLFLPLDTSLAFCVVCDSVLLWGDKLNHREEVSIVVPTTSTLLAPYHIQT